MYNLKHLEKVVEDYKKENPLCISEDTGEFWFSEQRLYSLLMEVYFMGRLDEIKNFDVNGKWSA